MRDRGASIDDALNDIDKQLAEAYSLAADHNDYSAALSACEAIIRAHPELKAPLRKKAQIYAHKADFRKSIEEITSVVEKGPPEPGDYFFRGWWNLEDDKASHAIRDLTKAIELGKQLRDDYFTESAHFFRAAASLRLGRYPDALADCRHVSDDFLIYLRSGLLSKAQIVSEAMSNAGS